MTASSAAREKLMAKVLNEISLAKHYRNRNVTLLEEYRKKTWSPPQVLKDACYRKADKIRIGYIVATCSPTTRAHIELAEQAIRDLGLTHVFFLVWPFHYIHGFHNAPINEWVEREKHIDLEHRENILRLSLLDAGTAASVFEQTEELYRASSENFSASDPDSFFWTGTWFVVRSLQDQVIASLDIEPANVSFYFICGEDQFNPNVHGTVADSASEKVWKDYSIAQHLALHNVYAVPRGGLEDTIEYFETDDPGFGHHVVIGERLAHAGISATKIRRGFSEPLEADCFPTAAAYIRENKFWGYGSAAGSGTSVLPAEIYEPLRKFISSSASFENIDQSRADERFVWADRTKEKSNDPYLIAFRHREQPHFQKYYVV